jgi:FKBP-type peptidyl-prolyl cis-trans isomerase 2
MKKFLIIALTAMLLLSGCVSQKTAVKTGDNVSIDYIGTFPDGTVFDTSILSVAKAHNLYSPDRPYTPLNFTVGKGQVIKGFDEGIIGMKVGETKILTISPEKGYGNVDPAKINAFPRIQEIPTIFPRVIEVPVASFEGTFGPGHKVGENLTLPNTAINVTIQNISTNVSLSYNFKVGDKIPSSGLPWNTTVVKIDNKNITVQYSVKKNDTIQLKIDQFQKAPWNTTVIGITSMNITLRHNAIPDTEIQSMFGPPIRVHFNETSIIMDANDKLAGKTLIFNITLKSINK